MHGEFDLCKIVNEVEETQFVRVRVRYCDILSFSRIRSHNMMLVGDPSNKITIAMHHIFRELFSIGRINGPVEVRINRQASSNRMCSKFQTTPECQCVCVNRVEALENTQICKKVVPSRKCVELCQVHNTLHQFRACVPRNPQQRSRQPHKMNDIMCWTKGFFWASIRIHENERRFALFNVTLRI